ncbi:hypothetical protein Slin14017_G068020 [Septoria linicola]|nr:hypothetical protein Slin14017_G068020 [Septoria linicola]
MKHPWFLVVGLADAQRWSNTTLVQDGTTLSTSTLPLKQSITPMGTAPVGTAFSSSSATKSSTSESATPDRGSSTLSSTLSGSSSSPSSFDLTAGVETSSMTASSTAIEPFFNMTDAFKSASSTGNATAAPSSTENNVPSIPGLLPSSTTISSATLSFPVPLTATPPVPVPTDTDAKKVQLKGVLDDTIPQLKHWVDGIQLDPKPVIDGLTSIKNMAEGMLGGISGSGDGGGGCSSGLFAALRCVTHGATDAVNGVTQGITDGLKGTLDTITNLSKIIPDLKPESESEDNNPDKPSSREPTSQGTTQSTAKSTSQQSSSSRTTSSSSSSECTQSATVTNDHVTCSPTVVGSTITSTTCKTSTSVVSGCSITGTTKITTVPLCSQTSTATAADVTCSPTVTSFAGQTGTTSWSCTTSTSVFSGCSVTGTTTTTSIAPSSTSRICAFTGCKRCAPGPPPSAAFAPIKKHGLTKRFMEVPGQYASYAQFIVAQISGRGRALCALLAHRRPPVGMPLAEARRQIPTSSHSIPFRSTPFSTGVVGLYGCTVVVIVSEAGVFLSHIFEEPTFINAEKATKEYEYGMVSDDAVWERDVTQNLFQGDTTGWTTRGGIMRLIGQGNIFQTGTFDTRVFIVTPTPAGVVIDGSRADDQYRHQKRVGDLKSIIRRRMAGLEASIITYVPLADDLESEDEMYRSARGKVLVQYDPEVRMEPRQVYDPEIRNYKVCYYPVAGWKLWVDEKELISDHYWYARPDQQGHTWNAFRSNGKVLCIGVEYVFSGINDDHVVLHGKQEQYDCNVDIYAERTNYQCFDDYTQRTEHQRRNDLDDFNSHAEYQHVNPAQPTVIRHNLIHRLNNKQLKDHDPLNSHQHHNSHHHTFHSHTFHHHNSHNHSRGEVCTCNDGQMVGLSTITRSNGNIEYLCAPGGGSGLVSTPAPKTTAAPKITEQASPTAKTTGCLVDSKGNPKCEQEPSEWMTRDRSGQV